MRVNSGLPRWFHVAVEAVPAAFWEIHACLGMRASTRIQAIRTNTDAQTATTRTRRVPTSAVWTLVSDCFLLTGIKTSLTVPC